MKTISLLQHTRARIVALGSRFDNNNDGDDDDSSGISLPKAATVATGAAAAGAAGYGLYRYGKGIIENRAARGYAGRNAGAIASGLMPETPPDISKLANNGIGASLREGLRAFKNGRAKTDAGRFMRDSGLKLLNKTKRGGLLEKGAGALFRAGIALGG